MLTSVQNNTVVSQLQLVNIYLRGFGDIRNTFATFLNTNVCACTQFYGILKICSAYLCFFLWKTLYQLLIGCNSQQIVLINSETLLKIVKSRPYRISERMTEHTKKTFHFQTLNNSKSFNEGQRCSNNPLICFQRRWNAENVPKPARNGHFFQNLKLCRSDKGNFGLTLPLRWSLKQLIVNYVEAISCDVASDLSLSWRSCCIYNIPEVRLALG